MMERLYVNDRDVRLRRLPKDIAIFGAGRDGQAWQKRYCEDLKIHYFLDNGIAQGNRGEINGLPVYNAAEKIRQENLCHIIVLSRDYQDEMCAQLRDAGLVVGKDYHVWEWYADLDLEHVYAFIEHNNKVWGRGDKQRKKRKILCTTFCRHCGYVIFSSYYGHVLAKKYNADIVGACIKFKTNFPLVREVYESFNVKEILTMELSESQNEKVQQLFIKIWSNLLTKDDWLAIEINGINFGHEIYRKYLRTVSGRFEPDKYEMDLRRILKQALQIIVYYEDYFERNDVKAVTLTDGLYDEGYVRILAWHYGAEVYSIDYGKVRYCPSGQDGIFISESNYHNIFNKLSCWEQKEGLLWARKKLEARIDGADTEISSVAVSPWAESIRTERLVSANNNLKVVIIPHSHIDDPYPYGQFMFSDHEEWLCFLGEMSEKTEYDWYIKYHPIAGTESTELWDNIVMKYPRIKKLPLNASPKQMRDEGVNFALTLWGSCCYEYPMLGIQVIAAGPNPYRDYNFCWQVRTIDEYKKMLLNLSGLHKSIDVNEIYQFYCIHNRYALPPWQPREDIFFPSKQVYAPGTPQPLRLNIYGRLEGYKEEFAEWQYRWFLDEFSPELHMKLLHMCREYVDMATAYGKRI